jgi:hypothetical protein
VSAELSGREESQAENGRLAVARSIFRFAGWWGVAVLAPQFFLEAKNGRDFPPTINHPEYYYGFLAVGFAWQVAFLIIARDPVRFRPLMLPSMIEKFGFGVAAAVLFALGRVGGLFFAVSLSDWALGALFVAAYLKTKPATE